MAWLDNNGVLYLWNKIKGTFATKAALKEVEDSLGELGYGDMLKSTYDTNNNGKVDTAENAEKVNGFTVGVDVPADAKFTDTTYTHPTSAGNKHIPSGGSSGQILEYSAAGTAKWSSPSKSMVGLSNVDNTSDANKPVSTAQQTALDGKVDKVDGKGLSTNDYTTTEKNKLSALPTNATLESTYAKKADITGVYKYKGSVASESALPTSGQTTGDVYDIKAASTYGGAGMNVVWTGSAWDALGEVFTITAITNTEIDTICV